MKNLRIVLVFVMTITFLNTKSQELKNAFGVGVQMQGYSDIDHQSDIIVDNFKRFSGAATIDYQRFLENNLTYTISLEFNNRKTYMPSNSRSKDQLFQSFLAMPIGFGWYEKIKREDKNAVKQHIANFIIGGYLESSMQQGIADSSEVYFDLKEEYFGYYRYGFYLEGSISILPSKAGYSGHTFGFQVRWNPTGAVFGENESVVQQSGYTIGAFFYRYLFNIKFRE